MEAKELEMIISSAELRNPNVYNASRERYVAEISFKAGYKQCQDDIIAKNRQPNAGIIYIEAGRKEGIKEVVGFAEETCPLIKDMIRWQAKLKEWSL